MSSSPVAEDAVMREPEATAGEDDPMAGREPNTGADEEEEAEGYDIQPTGDMSDDSSQEEDDDEEEAKKIRDGFIVDEDEDEDDEDEDEDEKRRRKRRKRRHRRKFRISMISYVD